jgi:hypothetical protein
MDMILPYDHHPDIDPAESRGRGMYDWWEKRLASMKGRKFLGYWRNDRHPDLPDPLDFVNPAWRAEHPDEYEAVVKHLAAGVQWESWRGYSWCRFRCGSQEMGSHDFSDGTYVWPEGFSHYVTHHDVVPPREFIDHVLASR